MKRILYKAVLPLFAVLSLSGCIEDKGHYDYKSDGDGIEFKVTYPDALYGFAFTLGEDIIIDGMVITHDGKIMRDGQVITPDDENPIKGVQIIMKDPSMKDTDLSYEWIRGGYDPIFTDTPVLTLTNVPVGMHALVVVVTDNRYGTKYACQFIDYTITSEYTDGWVVLSEGAGSSVLSYVRYRNDDFTISDGDVYALNNEGEELGGEPISLSYHLENCADGYEYALSVVQKGGIGPVDLNAGSMKKYVNVFNEFTGTPSFNINSISYKRNSVFALTDQGDVYVRPEVYYTPPGGWAEGLVRHATRFTGAPIYIERGMKITHWINYNAMLSMLYNLDYALAFDDLNKRIVQIVGNDGVARPIDYYDSAIMPGDPGTDGVTQFPALSFPGPDDLSGYDMVFMSGFGGTWDDAFGDEVTMRVACVLKSKSNGKYYLFTFGYVAEFMGGYHIELDKFYELPVQNIDQDVVYTSYFIGEYYLMFTTNNNRDLYMMDLYRGYGKVLYHSGSQITALKAGETSDLMVAWDAGDPGPYNQMFAVGTADGKFIVLDVSPSVMALGNTADAPELKRFETGMGKIASIEFMSNTAFTSSSISRSRSASRK